ncbi:DedA family protein [Sulfurimonas sp.]|nr:DedA family protein [Sulfurimonas sp.]
MEKHTAIIFASIGNVSAVAFNYYLGFFLYEKTKNKLLSSKLGRYSYKYGHKYGYWGLVLSWLPIIGDPLTFVAGLLRLNFLIFIAIVGTLRVTRYLLLAELF